MIEARAVSDDDFAELVDGAVSDDDEIVQFNGRRWYVLGRKAGPDGRLLLLEEVTDGTDATPIYEVLESKCRRSS